MQTPFKHVFLVILSAVLTTPLLAADITPLVKEQLTALKDHPTVLRIDGLDNIALEPSASNLENLLPGYDISLTSEEQDIIHQHIYYFLKSKSVYFKKALGYFAQHRNTLEVAFTKNNIDRRLAILPIAASGMNYGFQGQHGGSGIWQMSYFTASHFKLLIDENIDERRSIERSSEAAGAYAAYLKTVYATNEGVLKAFIYGAPAIEKAKRHVRGDESLIEHLPEYTRNLYYAYIAALYIVDKLDTKEQLNPSNISSDQEMGTVILSNRIQRKIFTKFTGVNNDDISMYNPAYVGEFIPKSSENYPLILPKKDIETFESKKDEIYSYQDTVLFKPKPKPKPVPQIPVAVIPANTTKLYYTVKSGDNLGYIASSYNVKVSQIKSWNNKHNDRIDINEKLIVYVPTSKVTQYRKVNSTSREQHVAKQEPKPTISPTSQYDIYTVKSGDTLWSISQKFPGVSDRDLMQFNNIGANLQVGQKIKIPRK